MDDDISFLGEPLGQISDDDLLGEPLGSLDGSIPDYDPLLGEPNAIPSAWDDAGFMFTSGAMDSVYGIKQKVTGDNDQGDQDRVKRLMEDPKMMAAFIAGSVVDPVFLFFPWARISQAFKAGKFATGAIMGTGAGAAAGAAGYADPDDPNAMLKNTAYGAAFGAGMGIGGPALGDVYAKFINKAPDELSMGRADKFLSTPATAIGGLGGGTLAAGGMGLMTPEYEHRSWQDYLIAGAVGGLAGYGGVRGVDRATGGKASEMIGKTFMKNYNLKVQGYDETGKVQFLPPDVQRQLIMQKEVMKAAGKDDLINYKREIGQWIEGLPPAKLVEKEGKTSVQSLIRHKIENSQKDDPFFKAIADELDHDGNPISGGRFRDNTYLQNLLTKSPDEAQIFKSGAKARDTWNPAKEDFHNLRDEVAAQFEKVTLETEAVLKKLKKKVMSGKATDEEIELYADAVAKRWSSKAAQMGAKLVDSGALNYKVWRMNMGKYIHRAKSPKTRKDAQEAIRYRVSGYRGHADELKIRGDVMEMQEGIDYPAPTSVGAGAGDRVRTIFKDWLTNPNPEYDRVQMVFNGGGLNISSLSDYIKAFPKSKIAGRVKRLESKGYSREEIEEMFSKDNLDWFDGAEGLVVRRNYTEDEMIDFGFTDDLDQLGSVMFNMLSHDGRVYKYMQDMRLNRNPITGEPLSEDRRVVFRNKSEWGKATWNQNRLDAGDPLSDRNTVYIRPGKGNGFDGYEPLWGSYMTKGAWKDLKATNEFSLGDTIKRLPLVQKYRKLNSLWKGVKTYGNPSTHVGNFMSNIMMYDIGGGLAGDLVAGQVDLMRKTKMYKLANKYNVFGGHITDEVMDGWRTAGPANDAAKAMSDPTGAIDHAINFSTKVGKGLVGAAKKGTTAKAVRAINRGAQWLYEWEDNVFRMGLFRTKFNEMKSKGMPEEDAAMEAARMAKETFVDYETLTPALEAMRETAFPFMSYTYGIVPKLIEHSMKNPIKVAKWGTAMHFFNEIMMEMDDKSYEELDKIKRTRPSYQQGGLWGIGPQTMAHIPGGALGVRDAAFDYGRWIPGGDLFGVRKSAGVGQISGVPGFAQPSFGAAGMLIDSARGIDAFSGQPITGEWGRSKHALRQLMPNLFFLPGTYANQKFMGAISSQETGRPQVTKDAHTPLSAWVNTLGFKVTPQDYKKNVLRISGEEKMSLSGIQKEKGVLKSNYNNGWIKADEFRREYKKLVVKEQAMKKYYAQRKMGNQP